MAKKIMKILGFLTVFVILTSAAQIPVFALTDNITSVSDTSARSANELISALQADQEVKFDGTAIEYFSSTGTCSWNVRVDAIISGPSGLQEHTVTVALWSGGSGEFPSGHMDPEIEPGNKVGVYGLYVDDDYVTLSGSEEYYITKTSTSNQPSVTVRYPNGGESISIGTQVQVSAHATDDNAVTGVTFYYSRDGGSNWNLIGEGVKVSGTDKDGAWNRTWNTDGLSAGTNYMIKAVASDGTSTSEDLSDGTFSLVGTIIPVEEWSKTFGGPGDDGLMAIQQTTDGGYILASITDSYGAGALDFWLINVKEGEAEASGGNTITNTIVMEFVLIPAGKFDMGSPSDEEGRYENEGLVHHVNIEKAFCMGRYEVTQKQWRAIMGDNPSYFKGDDLPVEQVSWDDV